MYLVSAMSLVFTPSILLVSSKKSSHLGEFSGAIISHSGYSLCAWSEAVIKVERMRAIRQHQDFLLPVACVAAVSSPFPGGDRKSERKSGRAKENAWGEQEIGKRWTGGEREGKGVGRKGIACSQSQTFYRTPFTQERRAIVQFDW